MKKRKIVLGLVLASALLGVTACNNSENPTTTVVAPKFITFEANNGTEIPKFELGANGLVTKPADPAKENATFIGWYTDIECTKEFDFNTVVNEEFTLYAKYEYYAYNVTLNSDGGTEFESFKYNVGEKTTLPIPIKSGAMFSHWEDENGNKYNSISSETTGDLNLKAIYKSKGMANVEFNTKAANFSAGSLTSQEDSIFTINGEVRGRNQTWTNPENSSESIEWKYSYKLGSSNSKITFKAPGDGKAVFYVQNGSSGAATQTVMITSDIYGEVKNKTVKFSGATQAVAPYPAGSPVVRIEFDVERNGEYTVARSGGTVDIYELNLECSVVEKDIDAVKVLKTGNTNFVEGQNYNPDGLQIVASHNNLYTTYVDINDAVIDSTNVDMTKPGVYPVYVNYGQYKDSFDVNVYAIDEIELGFNNTYVDKNSYNTIYVNGKVQTIYDLNEEFNSNYLTVTAKAKLNDNELDFIIKDGITYTGFDNTKSGEQEIEVTLSINGKEFKSQYTIYVVDTEAYLNTAGQYVCTVDQSYNGVIGNIDGENGNMFNTISQALEFLENPNIVASKEKLLFIKAGYYNEKIEINIPNLIMSGEGTCKATCPENENYDEDEYKKATIIEWDSLYGIPDEGGFSQVTDSVATVAVREKAVNCTIVNLTLSNYWNCEEIFTGNKDNLDYLTKMGLAVNGTVNDHRALALICQADKFEMINCSLLGYQDTVEFMTGRQFVVDTYISGNTDFIFGTNSTTYFTNCQIHVAYKVGGAGYITAYKGCNKGAEDYIEYGLIFNNCNFTADSNVEAGTFALGRPWGPYSAVMIMNSNLGGHISKAVGTRYYSMGGVNPTDETVRYLEYNNTGDGALTAAQAGVTLVDDSTAANYANLGRIFGTTNGMWTYEDAWVFE